MPLLVLAALAGGPPFSAEAIVAAQPREAASLAQAASRVVERTNQFRRKERLEPLVVSPILEKTAQDFANYMAKTDKYGHTADGRQSSERARSHGYDYTVLAENIGYQYSSAGFTPVELARRLTKGWEESPSHRKNILTADITEIGVGIARSPTSGRYYAVQLLGRPRVARHPKAPA